MTLDNQYEMLRKVPGFLNIGYYTWFGKHRFTVLSIQNSLFLYSYYLLYYFSYKKTVNILLPHPVFTIFHGNNHVSKES